MSIFIQDVRFGLRMLVKNPGFTAVAVVTLALGIGVNTAVFSFLDAMLLRPLAVPEASRVVVVSRGEGTSFSYPDYVDYRDRNQAFVALTASMPTEASFDLAGSSETVTAEAVSANHQDVMRVPLILGHWFPDEDEPSAVVSYSAWKHRFHADPKVLGKQVRSLSAWYTVVGVAPPDFTGIFAPMKTDLWIPLKFWVNQFPRISGRFNDRANPSVMVFGRLKPGVTLAEASANLNGIDVQLRKAEPAAGKFTAPLSILPVRGAPDLGSRSASVPVIGLLTAVAGLVLLIACVNVGNLLLARGAARQRELAMRVALGGGRLRIVRQLLVESILLALLAGFGGLVLGAWTNTLMERLVPTLIINQTPRLSLDSRVLAFTLGVALAAALIFGLLPAWHSTRTDVFPLLNGKVVARRGFGLGQISLVGEVALSLLLLLSAALFLRSILRLRATDPGFAVKNRLYAWTFISPPEFTPETGRRFYTRAVESLSDLPGVKSAALAHFLPLLDEGSDCVSNGPTSPFEATIGTTGPGYFNTMEIPLLEGRDFSALDGAGQPAVTIVNQTLSQRLWPRQSAVGRRIFIGCHEPGAATVVGVARDSKVRSLSEAPHPHFYRPFSQQYTGLATIIVQTKGKPEAEMGMIRRTLRDEAKSVRIYALEPIANHVEQSYWQTRWVASLLIIFGLLAMGLAVVGLYGVMAYHVTLRTTEFGVRMAVGAKPGDIQRLVLRQGFTIALVGIAIGLVGSLALTRLLARFLSGLNSLDPLTFVATAALWLAVAELACYIPARRATKVDPMVALRYE
jgi:predicted permease